MGLGCTSYFPPPFLHSREFVTPILTAMGTNWALPHLVMPQWKPRERERERERGMVVVGNETWFSNQQWA